MSSTYYNLTQINQIVSTLGTYNDNGRSCGVMGKQEYFINTQLAELVERLKNLLNNDLNDSTVTDVDNLKSRVSQLLKEYRVLNLDIVHRIGQALEPWLKQVSGGMLTTWKRVFPLMIDSAIEIVKNYDLTQALPSTQLSRFYPLANQLEECLAGKIPEKPLCNHLYSLSEITSRLHTILYYSVKLPENSPDFNYKLFNKMFHRRLAGGDKQDKACSREIVFLLMKEKINYHGPLSCERSMEILIQYKADCLDYLIDLKEAMTPLFK